TSAARKDRNMTTDQASQFDREMLAFLRERFDHFAENDHDRECFDAAIGRFEELIEIEEMAARIVTLRSHNKPLVSQMQHTEQVVHQLDRIVKSLTNTSTTEL